MLLREGKWWKMWMCVSWKKTTRMDHDICFQIIVRTRHDFLSETGHQPPRVEVGFGSVWKRSETVPAQAGNGGFFLVGTLQNFRKFLGSLIFFNPFCNIATLVNSKKILQKITTCGPLINLIQTNNPKEYPKQQRHDGWRPQSYCCSRKNSFNSIIFCEAPMDREFWALRVWNLRRTLLRWFVETTTKPWG